MSDDTKPQYNQICPLQAKNNRIQSYLERKYWCYNNIPGDFFISGCCVPLFSHSATASSEKKAGFRLQSIVTELSLYSTAATTHHNHIFDQLTCPFRRLISFVNCSDLLSLLFSRFLSLFTLFYCLVELDQIGVFLQWVDALFSPIWTTWVLHFAWNQHPSQIHPAGIKEEEKSEWNWHRNCCFLS